MEKKMYSVQIGDEIRQYEAGTTYRQIAAEHQKDYEDDIVLVFINDRLQELHKTLEGDCVMRFETCLLYTSPGPPRQFLHDGRYLL